MTSTKNTWAPRWLVELLGPDCFGTVTYVQLEGWPVTDDILPAVARLDQLEFLSLFTCNVTDKGLIRLAGLKRLRQLELLDCSLGDAGLRHLEALPQLQRLCLPQNLTDEGLIRLGRIASLREIYFSGTDRCPLLTKAGLNRLRIARPDLTVEGEVVEYGSDDSPLR